MRLGHSEDETAANCDWHFPLAHYLESWGDALTSDGTLVPVQPLVTPLFDGLSELEFLARLAGAAVTSAREMVYETFTSYSKGGEEAWKKFLHDGFLPGTTAKPVNIRIIAATHRELRNEVAAGRFRQDLYYRLDVVALKLPPLAERKSDIPLLAYYFLRKHVLRIGREVKDINHKPCRCCWITIIQAMYGNWKTSLNAAWPSRVVTN